MVPKWSQNGSKMILPEQPGSWASAFGRCAAGRRRLHGERSPGRRAHRGNDKAAMFQVHLRLLLGNTLLYSTLLYSTLLYYTIL